jgi:hypothetical protein
MAEETNILEAEVGMESSPDIPHVSCEDSEIDDILVALEVLSEIKVGHKLVWNEESIVPNIQYTGPFRPARRLFSTNNRQDCMAKLHSIIYKSIYLFKLPNVRSRIQSSLISANTGLSNLKETYAHDKQISSTITIMTQNVSKAISS